MIDARLVAVRLSLLAACLLAGTGIATKLGLKYSIGALALVLGVVFVSLC